MGQPSPVSDEILADRTTEAIRHSPPPLRFTSLVPSAPEKAAARESARATAVIIIEAHVDTRGSVKSARVLRGDRECH